MGKTCGAVKLFSLPKKRAPKAEKAKIAFPADFFALTPKNAEKILEISKNIVYNEKSNSSAVTHILCAILP